MIRGWPNAGSSTQPFHLVEMYFDSGTQYHTDAHRDVTWNGHTYTQGLVTQVDGLMESINRIVKSKVVFSGASQVMLAIALSEPYLGRACKVYKGIFDGLDAVFASPFVAFSGHIDKPVYTEMPDKKATLTWTLTSQLARFEAITGRRTTHQDQQIHFPGDLFFETGSKNLTESPWGKP